MNLIKSKQRVSDHGEVFTPEWLVEAMLDLVKDESERLDSRFLETACGSGNFLKKIFMRKLATVELKYVKSEFDRKNYAILSLKYNLRGPSKHHYLENHHIHCMVLSYQY